jgi:hypothetical protein
MLKTIGYAAAGAQTPLVPYSFEWRDPRPQDVAIAQDQLVGVAGATSEK